MKVNITSLTRVGFDRGQSIYWIELDSVTVHSKPVTDTLAVSKYEYVKIHCASFFISINMKIIFM